MDIPEVGKVRILDVYEKNETLVVEVETQFGKKKLSLGLNKKYVDTQTGMPGWRIEVKKLLTQLYGSKSRVKKDLKEEFKDHIGEINIDDLDKINKKPTKLKT